MSTHRFSTTDSSLPAPSSGGAGFLFVMTGAVLVVVLGIGLETLSTGWVGMGVLVLLMFVVMLVVLALVIRMLADSPEPGRTDIDTPVTSLIREGAQIGTAASPRLTSRPAAPLTAA
jgi:hypothetical protein